MLEKLKKNNLVMKENVSTNVAMLIICKHSFCVTNALCACLKKQTSCLLLFLGPLFLCDKIENNWKRVRHVPQSAGIWHPANDNLM